MRALALAAVEMTGQAGALPFQSTQYLLVCDEYSAGDLPDDRSFILHLDTPGYYFARGFTPEGDVDRFAFSLAEPYVSIPGSGYRSSGWRKISR